MQKHIAFGVIMLGVASLAGCAKLPTATKTPPEDHPVAPGGAVQDTSGVTTPVPRKGADVKATLRDSRLQETHVTWTVFGQMGEHSRLDSVPKNRTIVDYSFYLHQGINFTVVKNVTQELKAQNVLKTSCKLEGSLPSEDNQMAPYIVITIVYQ